MPCLCRSCNATGVIVTSACSFSHFQCHRTRWRSGCSGSARSSGGRAYPSNLTPSEQIPSPTLGGAHLTPSEQIPSPTLGGAQHKTLRASHTWLSLAKKGKLLCIQGNSEGCPGFAHLALPGQDGQVALDPRKLRGMPRLANPHQRPLVVVDHLAAMRESQAVLVAEAAFALV